MTSAAARLLHEYNLGAKAPRFAFCKVERTGDVSFALPISVRPYVVSQTKQHREHTHASTICHRRRRFCWWQRTRPQLLQCVGRGGELGRERHGTGDDPGHQVRQTTRRARSRWHGRFASFPRSRNTTAAAAPMTRRTSLASPTSVTSTGRWRRSSGRDVCRGHSGAREARTWNLEIPGPVLWTVLE
jgi:hypothetical protein